jgi:hypothetical protein
MRGCFFCWVLCLAISILIAACTKPPNIPELSHREPRPIEKIVLDDKISPKDLRDLYHAINQHGELDAIKSYVDEATDSELEAIGQLSTTYLYREGDAFRQLLIHRIRKRSFSQWKATLTDSAQISSFRSEVALLFSLLRNDAFPEVASRDIGLLGSEFNEILQEIHQSSEREPATDLLELTPDVSSEDLLTDLHLVLADPILRDRIIMASAALEKKSFAFNALKALATVREKKPGPLLYEGFGFTLRRMIQLTSPPFKELSRTYRNELDLLLFFAKTMDQKSQGLFQALSDAIAGNLDLPQVFLEKLQKKIDGSVAGLISEKLRQPQYDEAFWSAVSSRGPGGVPTPQFNSIYTEIRAALETLLGSALPSDQEGRFQFNLALHLNAFALTKWFELIVTDAENRSKLGAIFSETKFRFAGKTVTFAQEAADGSLQFPLHGQMTDPDLAAFVGDFEAFARLRLQPVSTYVYPFPSMGLTTWSSALTEAITLASSKQAIAPAKAVFHSLLYALVHPSPLSPFALAMLDSDQKTLLEILNQLIVLMTPEPFRKIERVIFEKDSMDLGEMTPDTIEFVKSVFEGDDKQPMRDLIDNVLNSVQMFYEFDKPTNVTLPRPASYPSAFEIYYHFLHETSAADLPWVSHLLSLLSNGRFAGEVTKHNLVGPYSAAVFPASYKTLLKGSSLASLLNHLSFIPRNRAGAFLDPLTDALGVRKTGPSGVEFHLRILEQLLGSDEDGVRALIEKALRDGWEVLPGFETVTSAERAWLIKFVSRGDHRILWDFFKKHASRESFLQFVRELQKLESRGALRNAFGLLTYLKDDRLRELATVLQEWERTGELKAALAAAEALLDIPARPRDHLPFHATEFVIDAGLPRPPALRTEKVPIHFSAEKVAGAP